MFCVPKLRFPFITLEMLFFPPANYKNFYIEHSYFVPGPSPTPSDTSALPDHGFGIGRWLVTACQWASPLPRPADSERSWGRARSRYSPPRAPIPPPRQAGAGIPPMPGGPWRPPVKASGQREEARTRRGGRIGCRRLPVTSEPARGNPGQAALGLRNAEFGCVCAVSVESLPVLRGGTQCPSPPVTTRHGSSPGCNLRGEICDNLETTVTYQLSAAMF